MMYRFLRIVEIMWLAIAAVSLVECIFLFNANRNKSLMFGAFFLIAVGMFFFRRHNRKKMEAKRAAQNQNPS
jgi:L-asparagine transporter-like permease